MTIDQRLPNGQQIDRYIIDQTISAGGFSIVYLAHPVSDQGQVVIKEYLPTKIAQRNDDFTVCPISDDIAGKYLEGRNLFLQEVSMLKKLKHPNIVNIMNSFEANGTVYIVMEYRPGRDLQSFINTQKGSLSEKVLRTVFPPLLEGLRCVHQAGLLHLDIKPGNVHIQAGGEPLLLDFGAVQRMKMSRTIQPRSVITAGFSPVEQYDAKGYIGPWTDIYAIGATLRTCIEGTPPPESILRREKDTMKPAVDSFKRKYNRPLLEAIDWAMEVDALLRPQTIDQFLEAFNKDARMNDEVSVLGKLNPFRWMKG